METKTKRCAVCGMTAESELKREFEGETYYFHTALCMVSFEIQLERIIAERERLLEDARRSMGIGEYEHLLSPNSGGCNDHARHG